MKSPLTALALAVLAAVSTQAAGDTVYVGANDVPRPIDVARALAGADFQPSLKKRGLSLEADAPAQRMSGAPAAAPAAQATAARKPAAVSAAPTPAPNGGTLAVAVAFAFDSADLTPPARAQLDGIAEGLKLLDAKAVVMIEGHTDAVGADAYNLDLSDRRAQAVKRYLVEQHGIAEQRLATAGKGEAEPLADTPPNAASNRRVAFRLG